MYRRVKFDVPLPKLTDRTIGNFPTKIEFISDFAKLASFIRTSLGLFLFFGQFTAGGAPCISPIYISPISMWLSARVGCSSFSSNVVGSILIFN
jgi:cytochrome c biogenesis protein CcdA